VQGLGVRAPLVPVIAVVFNCRIVLRGHVMTVAQVGRRQNRKFWPPRFPSSSLCLVKMGGEIGAEIRPDGQRREVVKTMRRIHIIVSLRLPDSDLRRYR
jgi:hypothetical protein